MNPFKLDINETTRFLLPIIFEHTTYDELVSLYFKQAYIGVLDSPEYDDSTIILEFSSDDFTSDLQEDIINYLGLSSEHLTSSIKENILVYSIPKDKQYEYTKFINAQYSKLSPASKDSILRFWGEEDKETSVLKSILYKTLSDDFMVFMKSIMDDISFDKLITSSLDIGWNAPEFWSKPNFILNEYLFLED